MIPLLLFIFGFGCTSSRVIDPATNNREPAVAPSAGVTFSTPSVIVPVVKLTEKQKRGLDSSLSPDVRKILESASELTLVGEIILTDRGVDYPVKESFEPNTNVNVSTPEIRKQILESFYADVAIGEEPADCWLPHHKLSARIGNEVVEIEICFSCSRFSGMGPSGGFSGTFAHGKGANSEGLFNKILTDQGRLIR